MSKKSESQSGPFEHENFGKNGTDPNQNQWNPSDFEIEEFLDMALSGALSEDEDIDWSAFAQPMRPDVDMDRLLSQIADSSTQVADEELGGLSDLSRVDAALVREQWPHIDPGQRRRIAQRLLELALDDLHMDLARFWRIVLHDDDARVRELAVRGLTGEVFDDLVGPFVQFLKTDADEGVRAAAAAALGAYILAGELDELDGSLAMRAEEALLDVLHDAREPLDIQCRALESIAFSSEVGIRQLIEDAYYGEDEELRASALMAMGRSADIRWRGQVCAELRNASPAMRAEAAYACGELEASDALRDLVELLDDEHDFVRVAAIFALGRLGGPEARAALEALANAPESLESVAATQALEEMEFFAQAGAIPLLNELLEHGDWEEDAEWDDADLDEWAELLNDQLPRDLREDSGVDFTGSADIDDLDSDLDSDEDRDDDR